MNLKKYFKNFEYNNPLHILAAYLIAVSTTILLSSPWMISNRMAHLAHNKEIIAERALILKFKEEATKLNKPTPIRYAESKGYPGNIVCTIDEVPEALMKEVERDARAWVGDVCVREARSGAQGSRTVPYRTVLMKKMWRVLYMKGYTVTDLNAADDRKRRQER